MSSKYGEEEFKLTTRNVGSLTTFQLRQELTSRNALDIPEELICHKSMLQRLIQVLLDEENAALAERERVLEEERKAALESTKALRERRKAEALERSKARQADPSYFQNIAQLNKLPEKANIESLESTSAELTPENEESSSDPFISCKQKSKVFVR
jgi:hypothetical protein